MPAAAATIANGCRPGQQWPTCPAASAEHTPKKHITQHTHYDIHAGSTNSLPVSSSGGLASAPQPKKQPNSTHHTNQPLSAAAMEAATATDTQKHAHK